jgi:hypothetical protein
LRFKLLNVVVGVNSLAIVHESATLSRTSIDHIEFDEEWRAVGAEAERWDRLAVDCSLKRNGEGRSP